MQIEAFREFIELAQCLSFTEAASRLNMTQPGLSKHILALEKELGIDLLDRDRSGITLSEGGKLFFETAMQIVDSYDTMRMDMAELKQRKVLKVGGHLGDSDVAVLLSVATTIARRNHNTALIMVRSEKESSLNQLLKDEIDACIAYIAPSRLDEVGVERKTLLSIPLVAIMDATNPLASRSEITLEDLRDETLLKYVSVKTGEAFEQLEKLCQQHGFKPKVRQVAVANDSEFFSTALKHSVLIWKKTQREIGFLLETGYRAAVPIVGDDAYLVASVIYKHERAEELKDLFLSIDEALDLLLKRRNRHSEKA